MAWARQLLRRCRRRVVGKVRMLQGLPDTTCNPQRSHMRGTRSEKKKRTLAQTKTYVSSSDATRGVPHEKPVTLSHHGSGQTTSCRARCHTHFFSRSKASADAVGNISLQGVGVDAVNGMYAGSLLSPCTEPHPQSNANTNMSRSKRPQYNGPIIPATPFRWAPQTRGRSCRAGRAQTCPGTCASAATAPRRCTPQTTCRHPLHTRAPQTEAPGHDTTCAMCIRCSTLRECVCPRTV